MNHPLIKNKRQVAIIGAGIGGLTSALCLARLGWEVTLLEQSTGFEKIGAGLQLSPNASRILVALGLGSALRKSACQPEQVHIRSLESGDILGGIKLGAFAEQRYDAPYYVIYRADLQTILIDAARGTDGIRFLMGRKVTDVQAGEHPQLTLVTAGGARETLQTDLIIGADGIWSVTKSIMEKQISRKSILKKPSYMAWRALTPNEGQTDVELWLSKSGHIVTYPVQGGKSLNIVAVTANINENDFHQCFKKLNPFLQQKLHSVKQWSLWPLYDQAVGRMASNHIALVGDAAHPILPFLAQGAALAIEDVAVLATCLDQHPLEKALKIYRHLREPRVKKVSGIARKNATAYHASGLMAYGRNKVFSYLSPEQMTKRYDWIYGFQVKPI